MKVPILDRPAGMLSPPTRGRFSPVLRLPTLILLLASIGTGCAFLAPSQGDRFLGLGDYESAIRAFEAEEVRSPESARVKRNMGIALRLAGQPGRAAVKLREAHAVDPDDESTLYFLGRALEDDGKVDEALAAYGEYLSRSRAGSPEVSSRIRDLTLERIRKDVTTALAREDSLRGIAAPGNTVAVLEFANISENETLKPLSKGLAAMLLTDLAQVRALRVLERQRIGVLLREIQLSNPSRDASAPPRPEWDSIESTRGIKERLAFLQSPDGRGAFYEGAIDEERDTAFKEAVRAFQSSRKLTADGIPGLRTKTALRAAVEDPMPRSSPEEPRPAAIMDPDFAVRAGQLLRTRNFVQGSFLGLGRDQFQLDAMIFDANTRENTPAGTPAIGQVADVMRMEKQLARQILEALGIQPSPEEMERIERLPTTSFQALLAFGEAIGFEDQGDIEGAMRSYAEALRYDPGFQDARQALEVLRVSEPQRDALDRSQLNRSIESPGNAASEGIARGLIGDDGTGTKDEETDQRRTDAETAQKPGEIPGFPDPPEN